MKIQENTSKLFPLFVYTDYLTRKLWQRKVIYFSVPK